MKKAYMNWSGGKDSALCLNRLLRDGRYEIGTLLTSVNAAHDRVSMHGVRRELLERQSRAIGLPLRTIELPEQPSMAVYDNAMADTVATLKADGYETAVFGDIFLEDLRTYREQKLAASGISCTFPLWHIATHELMEEFIALGFRAVVVCVNGEKLDRSFCGREIDASFVADLPADVDVCGENGEYHSFVYDGPLFSEPVPFSRGEVVTRRYAKPAGGATVGMDAPSDYSFYFCDLLV